MDKEGWLMVRMFGYGVLFGFAVFSLINMAVTGA